MGTQEKVDNAYQVQIEALNPCTERADIVHGTSDPTNARNARAPCTHWHAVQAGTKLGAKVTNDELIRIVGEWRDADEKAEDHRRFAKHVDQISRRTHDGATCPICSNARVKLEVLRIAIDEYRRTHAAGR